MFFILRLCIFFHFFQKFFDPLLKKWTPFTPSLPFWIACHAMHSELYNRIILKDRDKLKRSMSHIKFHVNRKRQSNNESIIVRWYRCFSLGLWIIKWIAIEAVVQRCSVKKVFCKKGVLRNFTKIHRETPVPESLF